MQQIAYISETWRPIDDPGIPKISNIFREQVASVDLTDLDGRVRLVSVTPPLSTTLLCRKKGVAYRTCTCSRAPETDKRDPINASTRSADLKISSWTTATTRAAMQDRHMYQEYRGKNRPVIFFTP